MSWFRPGDDEYAQAAPRCLVNWGGTAAQILARLRRTGVDISDGAVRLARRGVEVIDDGRVVGVIIQPRGIGAEPAIVSDDDEPILHATPWSVAAKWAAGMRD